MRTIIRKLKPTLLVGKFSEADLVENNKLTSVKGNTLDWSERPMGCPVSSQTGIQSGGVTGWTGCTGAV